MSDLKTYEYRVTEEGKVFSVESNWRGQGEREMCQTLNSDGYPSVRIIINGKRRRMAVHRLVALKFLGDRPSIKHQVRHMDGDKLNPKASNLAWGTAKQNAEDRERHGMTSRGPKHSKCIRRGLGIIAKATGEEGA